MPAAPVAMRTPASGGNLAKLFGASGEIAGLTAAVRPIPPFPLAEGFATGFFLLALATPVPSRPDTVFALFPVLKEMLGRRGGDLSGGQQQQLAIARALVMRPKLLVLDEPTEGIQPSIIKEIERVIRWLAQRGDMAILLVEQYFEFAKALADKVAVMDRGEVVLAGTANDLSPEDVKRYLTV